MMIDEIIPAPAGEPPRVRGTIYRQRDLRLVIQRCFAGRTIADAAEVLRVDPEKLEKMLRGQHYISETVAKRLGLVQVYVWPA
jgi:hypothetical protein